MKSNDKRMLWILNIENLEKKDSESYYIEYEIASECRIPGVLNYQNGMILCGLLTMEKDKNGLYHYLLKIRFSSSQELYNYERATKKGYFFKDGILGETLSILSIFFQCRFYLIANYLGELTSTGLKVKQEYDLNYYPCNPIIHPSIFSSKGKNFAMRLSAFFESIRSLNLDLNLKFILACHHYERALKEIGKDAEMVFIRLVSSIEALSKDYNLKGKDDLFAGKKFKDIINPGALSNEEMNELENTFENRKARKKFIRFIEEYSKGFFKGGNYKAKHTKILKKDLEKTLGSIYDARSKYLHTGEQMYLSLPLRGMSNWDIDPSLGMIIDRRKIPKSQKLPYTHFFEGLVRHCLMNYLEDNQAKWLV
jgi:hypothetical protein